MPAINHTWPPAAATQRLALLGNGEKEGIVNKILTHYFLFTLFIAILNVRMGRPGPEFC